MAEPKPYVRIDVGKVTHQTAPPYGTITFTERNSGWVRGDLGTGILLVGPVSVHYFQDGLPTAEVIYLRRRDVPPQRGPHHNPVTTGRSVRDSSSVPTYDPAGTGLP